MLDKFLCLPPNMSAHGPFIDHMMVALHWFMLILFVGWSCFFLYCLYRFGKRRNPKASYHGVKSHFSTHLELGVILVEVFLLLGFAIPFWGKRVNEFPNPADATSLRITGFQFGWKIHYPGKDGVFGKTAQKFYNKESNPLGLNPEDPNGKDDFVMDKDATVPVGKPVIIQLTSQDVIHNYCVLEMRSAQDAIPGSQIPMWFTPVHTGEFSVICGQLCGAGHYAMRGFFKVVTAEEYASFIADNTKPAK